MMLRPCRPARRIWESNGRLEGQALRDWLQAEAQLRAER